MAWLQKIWDFFKGIFVEKPAPNLPATAPTPNAQIGLQAPLSWEKYPENKPWSLALYKFIEESFDSLSKASDITKIRPDFKSLNKPQQITVLCELISAMSKFESGWNASSASQDVGTKEQKDTWSIGLMQMSVVDQESYGFKLGFDYATLLKPIPNLQLAVLILAKQVDKRGKLMITAGESGLYWAVLHPGGKYDQSAAIIKMVQALKFEAKAEPVPTKPASLILDFVPWIAVCLPYLGLNETSKKLNDLLVPWWAHVGLSSFKTLSGNDRAWCSLLADWAMNKVGIKGTSDAMALSWRTWGKQCPYWFGAVLGIRHASGGGHVTFFLYWVDESKKLAACLGGNQSNELNITVYNLSGNESGNDYVVNGPRWPIGFADGRIVSAEEVRKVIPSAPKASGSTR